MTRHKTSFFAIWAAVIASGIIGIANGLCGCADNTRGGGSESGAAPYIQNIDVTENTEKIDNPDQGFYRPIYVKLTESGIAYNKNIVTSATQLYHLRIDISAFAAATNGAEDKLLTAAALDGIEELLNFLRRSGKNAIVRFAYDPGFGGSADKEPTAEIIKEHIKQVCPILNKFEPTVTAVEVGLIGPWGEMHTSTLANAATITSLIEQFLSGTDNLPILVRTPKMIYNYLGITINDVDGYVVESSAKAYRLGMYNDGYLGSVSDLGTYTDREKEIAYLSRLTDHLPYGGEVVVPGSSLHDIEKCLPEMSQIHLSYLNTEWNNEVISKWKNSVYTEACGSDAAYYGKSAFTYIENRMGYRLLLTRSVFEYSDKFDTLGIDLSFSNVGFGNLNKIKYARLIFADESGAARYKQVGTFDGGTSAKYSVDLDLDYGKYDVYLCVYGEETAEEARTACGLQTTAFGTPS